MLGRKRRKWYGFRLALVVLALALGSWPLLIVRPQTALAHPLGNFTVNQYTRIELDPDHIRVRYVLDMAEIPTFQELQRIDYDGDGQVNEEEQKRYAEEKVNELSRGLRLDIDGKRAELKAVPESPELNFLPGQAGLQVLHLSAWFQVPHPERTEGQRYSVVYQDSNYANRIGWKEIVVRPSHGVSILQSSASAEERSNELLDYPEDLLKSPPDSREAQFTFELIPIPGDQLSGDEAPVPEPQTLGEASGALTTPITRQENMFTSLIKMKNLTVPVILLSLLVAMLWGAMHSLSPGHGKTIAVAYLVGSRATVRHAAFLGLSVTVTHTLSVFALGLVALLASEYVLLEDLFPWLRLTAGLLVVGLGIWLLQSRFRRASKPGLAYAADAKRGHDHHSYVDGHANEAADGHSGTGHSHPHPAEEHQHISWKSLLTLGISGGLLPCPSAILIMLSAISLDRTGFGILLVVAFSAGLAGVLTGIGLLVLYGQRLLGRLKVRPSGSLSRLGGTAVKLLPVGSAAVISLAGLFMTATAMLEM